MSINVALRLTALLTFFAVSGCTHLPSLASINVFSAPNPASSEVMIVESVPISPRMSAITAPVPIPEPTLESNPGSKSLASMLPTPLPSAELAESEAVDYSTRAVTLEDTQGVMDLPATYWAVQIAAVKNIERVAEMVKEHQLQGMLGVPMNTEAGPLHAVLTGVFVKREDALASAKNLPPVLAGYEPWVRPLAHLQAAMR